MRITHSQTLSGNTSIVRQAKPWSHEDYINAVYEAAKAMVKDDAEKLAALSKIKLVYGVGNGGTRGVTYYALWSDPKANNGDTIPLVEICATGQSNWTQVAGTVIHELAHVLVGYGHGHDKEWKQACDTLGLINAKAAGHNYKLAGFKPVIRNKIASLPLPQDGNPATVMNNLGISPAKLKPCAMGIGTRGGKSRGIGSGSRLVKCTCGKCGYTVRTTGKWLAIGNPKCPEGDEMLPE